MKKIALITLVVAIAVFVAVQCKKKDIAGNQTTCTDGCEDKKTKTKLSCKLTTPELRLRRETVIKSLKNQILLKKELADGYSYQFVGTNKMVDELAEFIKTERECCDFFVFNLSVKGDKSSALLEIKGTKGAKQFIKTELGM